MTAIGTGVDVCCGGWLTGDAAGCAGVGSSPAGIGVGSAAAVKPDGCTGAAAGIWREHTQQQFQKEISCLPQTDTQLHKTELGCTVQAGHHSAYPARNNMSQIKLILLYAE